MFCDANGTVINALVEELNNQLDIKAIMEQFQKYLNPMGVSSGPLNLTSSVANMMHLVELFTQAGNMRIDDSLLSTFNVSNLQASINRVLSSLMDPECDHTSYNRCRVSARYSPS
ncbi:unnamed protein product [Owenia fusiformis]|uniref:Uncharacterized protein n=1 Tax=Owenia fusiformis TaxID=6347 RepID=A0A8S4PLV8_OWEFU|nr:unnamed protein product [Owenia fusiformis]